MVTVKTKKKEDLEPLLDQKELDHLRWIKQEMRHLKDGIKVGLWEVACYCLSDAVLAQTLAMQLDGTVQPLPPHLFTPLTARILLSPGQVITSKGLIHLLPLLKETFIPPIQSEK